MAEPGLLETITLTQRNRREELVNDIEDNHPVLGMMKKYDAIERETGGRTLVEEFLYQEIANAMHYHGAQPLNMAMNTVATAAEFDWKQLAGAIVIHGREKRSNGGKYGVIKLAATRTKALEFTLKNFLEADLISDGTADNGLQIGGIKLHISTTPTSGTVGGIDRSASSAAVYRNTKFDTVNDVTAPAPGGAATSAATVLEYYDYVLNQTTRGEDFTQVVLAGQTHFQYAQKAMHALHRLTNESKTGKSGYRYLAYQGVEIVMGGGVSYSGRTQINTDRSYGINCRHTKFRVHKDAYFEPLPEVQSINQDAVAAISILQGNMTSAAPKLNWVMFDS